MTTLRLFSILVLLAAGCGDDGGGTDGGRIDSGGADAGGGSDSGGSDSGGGSDAGGGDGGVEPEYNDMGCITGPSASAICGFSSGGAFCTFVASCGVTDASQCMIDCEMAAAVFCIERELVEPCIAAVEDRDCESIASCMGWVYF